MCALFEKLSSDLLLTELKQDKIPPPPQIPHSFPPDLGAFPRIPQPRGPVTLNSCPACFPVSSSFLCEAIIVTSPASVMSSHP